MASNLLLPDIAGSFNQGYDRGQQQRSNQLLGQAIADPTNSAGAIGQAAAIDPRAALAVKGSIQDDQDKQQKKLAGAANYLLQAYKSGNPAQVEGAYQSVRPYLNQLGQQLGQGEAAPNFTEEMLPHLYQIVGQAGGDTAINGQTPTGLREIQGQIAGAGLSGDDAKRAYRVSLGLDPRAVTGAAKTGMITGADGRERPYVFDPATQQYSVFDGSTWSPLGQQDAARLAGGGGGPAAPAAPQRPSIDDLMREASKMANEGGPGKNMAAAQEHLYTQLDKYGYRPSTSTAGAAGIPPANGGLGVGRPAEETAGATERAKQQAQLEYLPQQEAVKTNAAVDQAGRTAAVTAQVKNSAELAQQTQQKTQDARQMISLLDEADQLLPKATGSSAGRFVDSAAAAVGKSTEGAQATAQLQAIAGRLTSAVPRMQGPQSDADVRLYQQMAGDLANPNLPVATRQAASRTIRQLQEKYLSSPTGNGTVITAPGTSPDAPAAAGNFGHLWN